MVKRAFAAALLVSVLASPSTAGEHLVTLSQMQAALAEQPSQRAAHLAQLDALLATPAAALPGVSLARARAVLATLDDTELSDLAARSQALTRDPATGGSGTQTVLVVLLLLLVAYTVLIIASGCEDNPQCLT